MAGEVFFVAGLFADKKNFSAPRAFAEDGLRATLPEIASFAISGRIAKSLYALSGRKELCR
jgi:hypothetical protein